MLVNDRVRVTSKDSTNGRAGTLVAIAIEDGEAHWTYRVKLDGQDVDHAHAMAFDAAELEVVGSYVVRLRSSWGKNRYLRYPGKSEVTTLARAHHYASLATAQAEANRYPTWREVVAVTVKRMVTKPVYGLKKVAA